MSGFTGRVDPAIEIPLLDAAARQRLFHGYAADLPVTDSALDAAAGREIDTTDPFPKELFRRAVLAAAEGDREVTNADPAIALDELRDSSAQLARDLLGAGSADHEPHVSYGGSY